jgi:L-threonylcarbamoyladenylate synthase
MSESKTRILPYSPEALQECAQLLRDGKLVGMPTETVYGLGANALDEAACKSIFTTKGRPLTDPLIVHVHSVEQALGLADSSATEVLQIFKILASKFWPGPLTLVVRANLEQVPMMITAETGFVGLRMPSSELALALLKESGVPIAAPSANKFGHVSPSKAEHVYNDFYLDSEVTILDGGQCSFGIESTVMKICDLGDKKFEFLVLRKGGVSEKALHEAIKDVPELQDFNISIVAKAHKEFKEETENLEGPGQFLRHYAPNIDSFLYIGELKDQNIQLARSVLIDFGGILASQKD